MILDGKKIAGEILEQLRGEVASLPRRPILVDVVIGDNPVTESYIGIKGRRAEEIGMGFEILRFPEDVAQDALTAAVDEIQKREDICGLLVQLPLPKHLNQDEIIGHVRPEFDVDGLTAENTKGFYAGAPLFMPATAAAVMALVDACDIADMSGLPTLVVGQGELVGKPVAFLLQQRGADVKVATRRSDDIAVLAPQAKLIITGAGAPGLLTGAMVQDGVCVIDAGTAESDGGIAGDVDFASVAPKAAWITPVPGGVGPVTVAMLLKNAVQAAKAQEKRKEKKGETYSPNA